MVTVPKTFETRCCYNYMQAMIERNNHRDPHLSGMESQWLKHFVSCHHPCIVCIKLHQHLESKIFGTALHTYWKCWFRPHGSFCTLTAHNIQWGNDALICHEIPFSSLRHNAVSSWLNGILYLQAIPPIVVMVWGSGASSPAHAPFPAR